MSMNVLQSTLTLILPLCSVIDIKQILKQLSHAIAQEILRAGFQAFSQNFQTRASVGVNCSHDMS